MIFPPELLEAIRTVERVVILTGSGISAESGIPTFRDAQTGLWSQYRPEDLATLQAFHRNPRLVWDWYSCQLFTPRRGGECTTGTGSGNLGRICEDLTKYVSDSLAS